MRTLVVYESIYGNTHQVAARLGETLAGLGSVDVVTVEEADADRVRAADLLVVGGPTHAHSLTTEGSRRSARAAAARPDSPLHLDPDAEGPGLRDWFHGLALGGGRAAAAFDTRVDWPAALSGRASRGIGKRLRALDWVLVGTPGSFLVDKENQLLPGELDRAAAWAEQIVTTQQARARAGSG